MTPLVLTEKMSCCGNFSHPIYRVSKASVPSTFLKRFNIFNSVNTDLQSKPFQNYFTVFRILNPKRITKKETKVAEYQRLPFFAFLFCPFFVPLCSLLLYLPVLNSKFIGGEADAHLHHLASVGLIWDGIAFRVNLVKSLLGGTVDL